ncbi:hypothetical protein INT47_009541 [Mucor saturninus]|uniref:Uncharacterized protein n=1 Tax=Mucor saturninus TaxID=64648 RepID=A0A8H7R8Y1_9FUNG|nr:hypothetical protein INT47_009541 [Mucor saturninus]
MSQFLLLQKYFQNIKIRPFMDGLNETVFQGWSQMHNLLFWMVSVMSNHWKLKGSGHQTAAMNGTSFLFVGNGDETVPSPTKPSLHKHQHNINRAHKSPQAAIKHSSSFTPIAAVPGTIRLQQTKPKSSSGKMKHPLATIDTGASYFREKGKVVTKKQSLTSMKNQMLWWKQKLSHRPSAEDVMISPTATTMMTTSMSKKSFLRRGGGNTSDSSSSSRSEPPSPTTSSILKSISFKLKRQQETVSDSTEHLGMRRLSLSHFKRKNSLDSLLK